MSEHREFSPVTPESEKNSLVELSNNTVQETNEVLEMVSHDEIEKDVYDLELENFVVTKCASKKTKKSRGKCIFS